MCCNVLQVLQCTASHSVSSIIILITRSESEVYPVHVSITHVVVAVITDVREFSRPCLNFVRLLFTSTISALDAGWVHPCVGLGPKIATFCGLAWVKLL